MDIYTPFVPFFCYDYEKQKLQRTFAHIFLEFQHCPSIATFFQQKWSNQCYTFRTNTL